MAYVMKGSPFQRGLVIGVANSTGISGLTTKDSPMNWAWLAKVGAAIAKGAAAVGKAVATGAKAVGKAAVTVGKGVGKAAKTVGKGVKTAAQKVGKGVKTAGEKIGNIFKGKKGTPKVGGGQFTAKPKNVNLKKVDLQKVDRLGPKKVKVETKARDMYAKADTKKIRSNKGLFSAKNKELAGDYLKSQLLNSVIEKGTQKQEVEQSNIMGNFPEMGVGGELAAGNADNISGASGLTYKRKSPTRKVFSPFEVPQPSLKKPARKWGGVNYQPIQF